MVLTLLLSALTAEAREAAVASPDGKLVVTVNDTGGQPTYDVTLDGQQALRPSRLGLNADYADFTRDMSIVTVEQGRMEKSYKMRQTKQSARDYVANTLMVTFRNDKGLPFSVRFQVSNNDVAFRYILPRPEKDNPKCAVIRSEATSFLLPDNTMTFLTPQITPMTGWERTKPSYEEDYVADVPMNTPSKFGQGYTFPCLFKTSPSPSQGGKTNSSPSGRSGEALWLLISETGVDGSYVGSHLSDYQADRGYTIAFPQEGENNGIGSPFAGVPLPYATPWRTITVGATLKPVVETTVAYDVVGPKYEPSQDYQAGRYTWSWLIWQDNSINYDDQVRFIDLAARMGYEYCLVDNWWDKNIGRDRMEQLSAYAQSKGVSLLLWYNSNGFENDAPQTPRDCLSTAMARDREMAWLKKIGVKGIKVDFFGGDKQVTMQLYEDILYDANRYGLQVVFHGCTLPRGWEVMYPNFVASEAVLASENVYFSESHARSEAFELTMHPFCRNAVASMDWGGVIMNKRLSKDNKGRHRRYTTDAFEMASAFINQTAVQCVALQPNNLHELPEAELDFLRRLPTTWDETRFIDGYPGRYVVLARRSGSQWYVAGLNAGKEPLTLTVDLADYGVNRLMNDTAGKKGMEKEVAFTPLMLKSGKAKIVLQPNGGFVAY